MWVNSKQAAEILGVNNKSVEKAAFRATKSCKKFCTIKCHLCHFTYTDGIGRGGKTLQIWIDDDLINNKNSEISPAGAFALTDSKNVKAAASGITESARRLNFTQGEDDGKGLCHRANHRGDQAQGGKLDGLRQGVCDAFGGREKEQKANANMLGNNRLVTRDRKGNKGVIGGNNAMDASDSVDIWSGNGGDFGAGFANAGDRRDQEQTQINQNERINDGYEHRDIGADVYDTCAGSETNRSPLPLWQINEQGEASAYIKAHAGDGLHQCEGNPVYQLRFQARSESQRGAERGAVKGVGDEDNHSSEKRQSQDEAQNERGRASMRERIYADKRLCASDGGSLVHGPETHYQHNTPLPQIYETRGESETQKAGDRGSYAELNLSGAGETNSPATLCLPQAKTDAQIRVELSKTRKGLEAQQKEMILKEYARAKAKGVKVVQFIEYINNHRMYSVNLTQNKLFAWQRAYEAEGIEGLVDGRTSHKENQIEAYGLEDKFIELIFASNKRIDAAAICQKLNEYLAVKDALDVDLLANTYAKRKTPITVSAVRRRIKKWQNDNPLADVVRRHGVDKARGMKQPAIGDMNWNITSINQVVEIDATSLDMICINTTLAKMLGMSEDEAKKLQKRFCIISIIDVYSHVRVYQICESENSLAVQRCLAKYILRYGKPAVIRGDNGKAFLSGAVQSAVIELGIEYHAVTPYSGWKKPFVERNFGVLQSNFTAALAGYIGSCVAERVGLEGLYGKADKRAKKGEKTRLENLMSLEEVTALLDMYAEGTINNTAFGKDKKLPRELYDEKVEEAVYMHEYEVMALIGGIKTVKGGNKKGIQYLGDTYVFSGLFRYSQISFSINLNNISQLFVFNENRDFIGMAVNNKEGVTKEQAKAEVKLFEKELREAQKRVEKARVAMSKDKVGVIKVSYEHLPRAKYPMPKAANNAVGEMIKTQAEKAANLMRNGQISDAMLQNAAKPKKKKRSGGYVENMMRKRA